MNARRPLISVLLALTFLTSLLAGPASAVTGLEGWRAGTIMTDAAFWNAGTMNTGAIRDFIQRIGRDCVPNPDGTPCLKDYRVDTPAMPATQFCTRPISAMPNNNAAQMIADVAYVCGLNPQVLLVLLQKEQGLLTASGTDLTPTRYARATGAGCPDGAPCDPATPTFFLQVYSAAERFNKYRALPDNYNIKANASNNVRYHPNPDCRTASVFVTNQATAGLYNYTPYTPNSAALAAGSGTGDACSAYGNRNFFRYMKLWFPQSVTSSTAAPVLPTPASPVPAPAWVKYPFAATIFRFDGSTTHAATYAEWRAAGFVAPFAITRYDVVRYPWSPHLYAVSFVGSSAASWAWQPLNAAEWAGTGNRPPRNADWIAGSTIIQWGTSTELFLDDRGLIHRLTYREWQATGFQPFTARKNEGFVQCGTRPEIYYVPDLTNLATRTWLTAAQWAEYGHPTPRRVSC